MKDHSHIVSNDGKERLHFDEAAMQIIQGRLGVRGILQGSEPAPRFIVQLMNALRERSGMVADGSDFKGQVIPKVIFDESLEALEQIFQLRLYEEQQRSSKQLACVGWVLAGVGILLGALQFALALFAAGGT